MSKQHIGRQSDSLEDDGRTAAREQMKAVMKPRNKAFSGKSELGNGEVCPKNPDHGKMYHMPSGRDWCPHSDHTSGKVLQ